MHKLQQDTLLQLEKDKLVTVEQIGKYKAIYYTKRSEPNEETNYLNPLLMDSDGESIIIGLPRILPIKYYNGEKIVSVKEKIDGIKVVIKKDKKLGTIILVHTSYKNISMGPFRDLVDEYAYYIDSYGSTFILEVISQAVPLTISYQTSGAFLVDKIDNNGNSLELSPREKTYNRYIPDGKFNNISEMESYVNNHKGGIEGLVIKCDNGKRYKIISSRFKSLRSVGSISKEIVRRRLLKGDNIEDIEKDYPARFRGYANSLYRVLLSDLIKTSTQRRDIMTSNLNQKDFYANLIASGMKKNQIKQFMQMYKGKLYLKEAGFLT